MENEENWLQNHLWCPDDRRGLGIEEDDDDDVEIIYKCNNVSGNRNVIQGITV